jgi:hypothetical protein
LNNNLKSLAQKVDNEDDERNNIVVSNKYQILKPIEEEKNKELFLETDFCFVIISLNFYASVTYRASIFFNCLSRHL